MIGKVHTPVGFNGLRYSMPSNGFSAGYNRFEITPIVFIPSGVLEIYEENKKEYGAKKLCIQFSNPQTIILFICIHATPRADQLHLLFSTTFHGDNEVWDDHTVGLIIPYMHFITNIFILSCQHQRACMPYIFITIIFGTIKTPSFRLGYILVLS